MSCFPCLRCVSGSAGGRGSSQRPVRGAAAAGRDHRAARGGAHTRMRGPGPGNWSPAGRATSQTDASLLRRASQGRLLTAPAPGCPHRHSWRRPRLGGSRRACRTSPGRSVGNALPPYSCLHRWRVVISPSLPMVPLPFIAPFTAPSFYCALHVQTSHVQSALELQARQQAILVDSLQVGSDRGSVT